MAGQSHLETKDMRKQKRHSLHGENRWSKNSSVAQMEVEVL